MKIAELERAGQVLIRTVQGSSFATESSSLESKKMEKDGASQLSNHPSQSVCRRKRFDSRRRKIKTIKLGKSNASTTASEETQHV